ncbi:MAG: DUF4174 domain-containing protein [Bacteroidota bacterium]
MVKPSVLFLALFISSLVVAYAQDLSSLQWKNRLVIVLANDEEDPLFTQQMKELSASVAGLSERRIVVYQVLPKVFRKGLNRAEGWQNSSKLYQQFKRSSSGFEVILIGLDGGIKLREEALVTCEQLFGLIDQMPMRKAEMRQQKNTDRP